MVGLGQLFLPRYFFPNDGDILKRMDDQYKRLETRLDTIESKINAVFESAEKTRKYFLWTFIMGIVVVLLPLLFLPAFLSSFMGTLAIPGL
mgnify:CR=1 FL=1